MEVKLSSKGQIVIPKTIRDKLGLKPGDKLRLEITEGRGALIQPAVKPPKEVFVRGGGEVVETVLQEAREIDEKKIEKLLRTLGVRD